MTRENTRAPATTQRPAHERGRRCRAARRTRRPRPGRRCGPETTAPAGRPRAAPRSPTPPAPTTNAFSVGVLRLWPTVTRRSGSTRPMRSCTAGKQHEAEGLRHEPHPEARGVPDAAPPPAARAPPWTTTAMMPTMANTAPMAPSPKPRRWCAEQRERRFEGAERRHEQQVTVPGRRWRAGRPRSGTRGRSAYGRGSVPSGCRSGLGQAAERHEGVDARRWRRRRRTGDAAPPRAARPPMAGPSDEPDAVGGAQEPEQALRSSGPTRSVADACATATLPPDAPSRTRGRRRGARASPPAR